MVVVSVARSNADASERRGEAYWNYECYDIPTGDIEKYQILQRIGRGKYSEVFEGRRDKEKVVIKALKPVRKAKISREVLVLKNLSHRNIIRLMDVVVDSELQTYSLVFEYVEHEEYSKIFEKLGYLEIVEYSRQILSALAYCHGMGIIHRDIKPQNMVISRAKRELKIIDWGLAEFYHPGREYSVRVASRYYKSPELLVGYGYYDYSLDIWSFGCVLAELVFKKRPFFHGESNGDQLVKIVRVLGHPDLRKYLERYGMDPPGAEHETAGERVLLSSFLPPARTGLYSNAIDLLEKILVYDHQARPTAEECLAHPFFSLDR